MAERFVHVGQAGFPGDKNVRCDVFEWRVPNERKFGRFKIRFLCPCNEPPPRRFFVEPILNQWLVPGDSSRFLEQACKCGHKILRKLDHLPLVVSKAYDMYAAVFRNRDIGHFGTSRRFSSVMDFVDFDPLQGRPSVITPGFSSEDQSKLDLGAGQKTIAMRLLQEAFSTSEEGGIAPRKVRRSSDVIAE